MHDNSIFPAFEYQESMKYESHFFRGVTEVPPWVGRPVEGRKGKTLSFYLNNPFYHPAASLSGAHPLLAALQSLGFQPQTLVS